MLQVLEEEPVEEERGSHGQKKKDWEMEKSVWFGLNKCFNGLFAPDADKLMQWLFGKYHQPFWLVLALRAEHLIGHRACQSWRSGWGQMEKWLICHWTQQ